MSNRHAMNWGLLVGLVFCLNFWVGTIPAIAWLQYIVMAAEIYLIYRLASHCRKTVYGGTASYGQMLWYIVQLMLYASFISALFKYLYCKVIVPDYLDNQVNMMLQLAESMPQLASQFDELESTLREVLTPLNMAIQGMWVNLLAALFLGLILAAFLRKDDNPFDNNPKSDVI